jgi:hypothetical protein
VKAFLIPINLEITIMLGNLSDGPARRNAVAIPRTKNHEAVYIGTSVKVAKYMNVPKTEAIKIIWLIRA